MKKIIILFILALAGPVLSVEVEILAAGEVIEIGDKKYVCASTAGSTAGQSATSKTCIRWSSSPGVGCLAHEEETIYGKFCVEGTRCRSRSSSPGVGCTHYDIAAACGEKSCSRKERGDEIEISCE